MMIHLFKYFFVEQLVDILCNDVFGDKRLQTVLCIILFTMNSPSIQGPGDDSESCCWVTFGTLVAWFLFTRVMTNGDGEILRDSAQKLFHHHSTSIITIKIKRWVFRMLLNSSSQDHHQGLESKENSSWTEWSYNCLQVFVAKNFMTQNVNELFNE